LGCGGGGVGSSGSGSGSWGRGHVGLNEALNGILGLLSLGDGLFSVEHGDHLGDVSVFLSSLELSDLHSA